MLYQHIQEAFQFIRAQTLRRPKYGIILGTGLGSLIEEITEQEVIPYDAIPHFPVSTVESHAGQLVFGQLDGVEVVAMAGRFHYYEGYDMKQVGFPVRVMKTLGIQHLIISNAAGSTNAQIEAGDLVFVRDHINLHPENPLRGSNDERLGPRFPDMLHAYDRALNAKALELATQYGIRAHEGVYVGLPGPSLETPAEYRFINTIGGDLVGMSTIPEVIVAKHMGLPVFVVSVATNKCFPIEAIKETSVEDVIAVAREAEPRMRLIVRGVLASLEGRG
ncbi:MAG TPA: purine-nucleoside phosphorylase [Saprospiraceae bacterium]|mgnify:CR=1 FL=1|nr:purine-nucleoside phosphorylase [Saprospiraceae bacterium]HMQ83508.1 purine-nucleoside phosphorylase [Saprospiraceae bacterium]